MRGITRFKAVSAFAAAVLLAACGGAADPAAEARVQAAAAAAEEPSTAPLQLFVPDLEHGTIAGLATLPEQGETLAARPLRLVAGVGNNLQLDRARDQLYAISGRHVVVYAGAAGLAPDALPARRFPLPTVLRTPRTMYLDAANDVLYVGGEAPGGLGVIVAYASAHTTRGISAAPARTLFVDSGIAFFTIDTRRRRLYVANTAGAVRAYAGIDSANGLLAATTTYPVLGSGLAVDAMHDRLYVADLFAGLILVEQASAPQAVVSATLSISDARQVAFDAVHDRAIVSTDDELYVFEHASALGAATPLPAPAKAPAPGAMFGAAVWR